MLRYFLASPSVTRQSSAAGVLSPLLLLEGTPREGKQEKTKLVLPEKGYLEGLS
jgi:hypothetical protein